MITYPSTAFFAFAAVVAPLVCQAKDMAGSPTYPVQQKGWEKRHNEKVAMLKDHKYDLLMIGDSITHNLDNPPYKAVWDQFFGSRNAINLGYSGGRTENTLWNLLNGELENQSPKAITLLIGTNNTDNANYPVVHTPEQVFEGTQAIIKLLRQRCPDTKILLLRVFPRTNVYKKPDGTERGDASKRFADNLRAGELIASLADNQHVFYLDVNHVFLKPDGTIDKALMPDLLHPSPEGSKRWAEAMEPTLSKLMGDTPKSPPSGNNAVIPVSRLEKDSYDWFKRHESVLALQHSLNPDVVLIGDSITHFWGGQPQSPGTPERGPVSWKKAFGDKKVLNMGFGWDRTQNVLWRIDNGELMGIRPKTIVVNIGTNNFTGTKNARVNTPSEVAEGIREVILRLKARCPEAKIVLMGIFPCGRNATDPKRKMIADLDDLLRQEFGDVPGITFIDIKEKFLQPDGTLPADLMPDSLHPSDKGYAIWAEALNGVMR